MAVTLKFFPESYIQLNKEISMHPELIKILDKHPAHEFEVRLSQIAMYCDVILDGYYMPFELEVIADKLYNKLREKRNHIITVRNFNPVH